MFLGQRFEALNLRLAGSAHLTRRSSESEPELTRADSCTLAVERKVELTEQRAFAASQARTGELPFVNIELARLRDVASWTWLSTLDGATMGTWLAANCVMSVSNVGRSFAPSPLFAIGMGLLVGAAIARRRHRFFELAGRNALVTGGARGLGLEIARILVAKGANVAIVARDDADIARALEDLHRVRSSSEVRVVGEMCDLRDGASIDTMLDAVERSLGPIDVLVNNAGTIQVGPLDAMTVDDFEEAMKVHCFAPLRTMMGVHKSMRARGGGRIANVSSIGGLISVPHLLPYSASKFALVGLSQGMRTELARHRIFVSTIAPGLMRTGSPRHAQFKGDHEKEYAWFAIADSLPLLTMSSTRAARRIVRAIEWGEPQVVLGLPAKLAALANALAPRTVSRGLALTNSLLPRGADHRKRFGFESESALAPSVLTILTERAAVRNNQL